MPKAARAALLAVLALLLAACGEVLQGEPAPTRAPAFRPEQVRRPLVLVRLVRGPGEWEERESRALPDEYQGALLEALNARAVLAREVQVRGERDGRLDAPAALARARELGADHAVLVEIRVAQVQAAFCRDSRRAFRPPASGPGTPSASPAPTSCCTSASRSGPGDGSACDFQRMTK